MRRALFTPAAILAVSAAVTTGAASRAWAEEESEKSPLEGQPAVRGRLLLRKGRFEIGPSFGFTLAQPFRHSFLVGFKGEYQLWDWLGAGAVFAFGAASFDTGLTKEIDDVNSFATSGCDEIEDFEERNECRRDHGIRGEEEGDWHDALNETAWAFFLRGTVTPFAGKMALFSRLFWPYDFYGFGGLGVIGTKNKSDEALGNDGVHIGPHFGGGIHVYFNQIVALSLEFSDTLVKNNPSGRNVNLSVDNSPRCDDDPNLCNRVDGDDARTFGYYLFMFNVTAHLPFEAVRSK